MSQDERSTPAPLDALLPLATAAADAGDYDRVRELYLVASARGVASAASEAWARLLREAGALDLLDEDSRVSVAQAPADSPAVDEDRDEVWDFEPGERDAPAVVPSPLAAELVRLFGGRGDVYARQWHDARADRTGYQPVREPLTPAVAAQHLEGRITIGQYVLHPDATVSFAALDLDPTPEAWEELRLGSSSEGGLGLAPLADYARRVLAAAARLHLPAIAEDTGGFGLHIWFHFEPRLAATRARALLRELLWRAGPQPPAVSVEIFPKQDTLSGKGLGNLIKLPLGLHQATLRRSRLLDATLQPLDDATALSHLRPCPPDVIDAVLASRVIPLRDTADTPAVPWREETSDDDAEREAPTTTPNGLATTVLQAREERTPRTLAAALAAIPPGREANAAADRVLAGCVVIRELARRAFEDHALAADAARALLYTVGVVGRGNERIDHIWKQAGLGRKELERIRRGLQAPMGCRKLHELFPALASACTCPEPGEYAYATPALYALLPPVRPVRSPPAPRVERQADVPRPEATTIEERLARIERALSRLLAREDEQ